MNEEQVAFINALDEQERYIIKVAAFMASYVTIYDVGEVVLKTYKIQPKKIADVLNRAVAVRLFRKEESHYGSSQYYYATINLITALYPFYGTDKKLWKSIKQKYYRRYYSDDTTAIVSDLIFNLLFDEAAYKQQESNYIHQLSYAADRLGIPDFSEILIYEQYEKVLRRLGYMVLIKQLTYLRENYIHELASLDVLNQRFERVHTLVDPEIKYFVPSFKGQQAFHAGKFDQAFEAPSFYGDFDGWFIQAIKSLIQGEVDASLKQVDKGMKEQRKIHRGSLSYSP